MINEENFFRRFVPDFMKLEKYGFVYKDEKYYFEKKFKENEFKAEVLITSEGSVFGKVFDLDNNGEYLPLRVEKHCGEFSGVIRAAYERVLDDIRDKCFIENYFIYPQSNRIAGFIGEIYKDKPEFLWEKSPRSGVFRNPDTNKWYAIIMNIGRNKLERTASGEIEIINLKINPGKIPELLQKKGFYPAYHMNKKSWITVVLDESLCDCEVVELIGESHNSVS